MRIVRMIGGSDGAEVVEFSNDDVALKISGEWRDSYEEFLIKNKNITVWLNTNELGDSLKKVLGHELSSSIHLMGAFPKAALELLESALNLKRLTLQLAKPSQLNLSKLARLEYLYCSARDIQPNKVLPGSLTQLRLVGYNATSLIGLQYLHKLRNLELIQPRLLANIEGVGAFRDLESIALSRAPKLTDISAIEVVVQLHDMILERCQSISEISPLSELNSLRNLSINQCGTIESLNPIIGLQKLGRIMFVENTNIVDGRIAQLASIPSLRVAWYQNRRHYDITREELKTILDSRSTSMSRIR